MTAKFQELVAKLKEIFQLDKPELDFGIYRIMHMRAKEIGEFLEKRLAEKVRTALAGNSAAEKSALEKELDEAIKSTKALGFDPEQSPKVQELRVKLAALGGDDEAEASVYSHLLTFFSRYYDDGDFISKRRYKEGVYAIPYEGEEVKLHWANADQYYVKSGESFQNYSFRLDDGKRVNFKLVTAETAKDNIKDNDAVRCFVLWNPEDAANIEDEEKAESLPKTILEEVNDELNIYFQYLKFKKGTKQTELIKTAEEKIGKELGVQKLLAKFNLFAAKPTEKDKKRTVLTKHLQQYVAKNTSDYFIHKDLKGFLTRELDFYIKNEMMHLDDVVTAESFKVIEQNLRKIQAVRTIASELITFMAQLEDFQKKLWLKKKFVTQCDYCLTMDRIPEELRDEVFANEKQQAEWKRLGFPVGRLVPAAPQTKQGDLFAEKKSTALDARMVDTKFFGESFKAKLLRSIPDLDEQCGGVLVHAENYAALRLILTLFEGAVDVAYIDPPYNTAEGEFSYKDNYRNSSWLSMMDDRVRVFKRFGGRDSRFFVSIDDRENANLIQLLYSIFGDDRYLGAITWEKRTKSQNTSTSKRMLQSKVEFIHPFSFSPERQEFNLEKVGEKEYPLENDSLGKYRLAKMEVSTAFKRAHDTGSMIYDIKGVGPGEGKSWQVGKATVDKWEAEGRLFMVDNWPWVAFRPCDEESNVSKPFWSHFFDKETYGTAESGKKIVATDMGFGEVFKTVKPVELIKKILFHSTKPKSVVLDYFGGSGTTAHAVIALNREDGGNRKYILVEMGDHFDTVLKPRIEKVVYSADWKDGKPTAAETGISHCFKYMTLESYEDALNNIELDDKGKGLMGAMKDEYLIGYMMDLESKGSLISTDDFRHPFDYKLKIAVDSSGASEARKIDLVETFNYLIGLKVAQYLREIDKEYVTVEGTSPKGEKTLVVWRDVEKVDNAALNKLLDKLGVNPSNTEFDVVYVNGDHAVANMTLDGNDDGKVLKVRQIENEFMDRMFEDA